MVVVYIRKGNRNTNKKVFKIKNLGVVIELFCPKNVLSTTKNNSNERCFVLGLDRQISIVGFKSYQQAA